MSKLIPDYVFDSIYDITPALLESRGVPRTRPRCRPNSWRRFSMAYSRRDCACWCFPTTVRRA